MEKVVKFKIKLGLPFIIPDLEYNFIQYAKGELKLLSGNQMWAVPTDVQTWVKRNALDA